MPMNITLGKETLQYSHALAELSLQGTVSVFESLSVVLILKSKSNQQTYETTFERRKNVSKKTNRHCDPRQR